MSFRMWYEELSGLQVILQVRKAEFKGFGSGFGSMLKCRNTQLKAKKSLVRGWLESKPLVLTFLLIGPFSCT